MPSIGCVFISFQTYAATQSTAWKQLYEVHIKPVLGFLPLSQINSDDIQMLINAKAQELSYSYIKKIYEFLNGFFKYAKQRGIITTNPCDAVIVPKEEHVAVKTRRLIF